ncbi:nucleoporin NUP42 [Papilio machaon]|uniref:nucleoporin NUP42 n=1 Tax=Papilio machaon TaxID=76193 RepID=UPI001E6658FF|nr:nucleoporin NUP42 [Papilio machaon]XP_045537255.1 nucleoporin NUP42 [Papilio machaon]
MVVCKFFQQGYCRYGQNCRFEHIYGSKYSYHANPPAQTAPAQSNIVTDEQLVNQVKSDIQAALKGGQWILSSYAPFKEKPGYPGLSDLSPEEARLFMYEAKANNSVEQAVVYFDNLYKESRYKYEQLLQPTVNIIKILRSIYKGETVTPPQASFGSSNNASSLFRSALSNTNTSVFNQTTNQSVFGPNTQTAAKSIFAEANQATFGPTNTNIFATNETVPKSLFAQETQKIFGPTPTNNPVNIFASATQNIFGPTESVGQNVFASQPSVNVFQKPDQPSDVFERKEPQNVFSNVFEQNSNTIDNIYSKLEDLSNDELEAFKSNEFKLGFIPELPPPKELCF